MLHFDEFAANVVLIQHHSMVKMLLQSALKKHPLDVGAMIFTLLRCLRLSKNNIKVVAERNLLVFLFFFHGMVFFCQCKL